MKRIFTFLSLLVFFAIVGIAQSNLTPDQVLAKAVALISNAKGVEAKFTVYNSGYSGGGTVKTMGKKFNVTMPDAVVWYNGTDLYTYNINSNETTVVSPTPEELAETNPLAYVSGASKNYNVSFSTVKKSGRYVLELIPKDKKTGIKRITLTLKSSDYTPEKIVVEPDRGNPVSAEINSFKTGLVAQNTDFEYPSSKYPKAEIIDLR